MIKYTLLVLASAAGLAASAVGCQQSSKHASVDSDYETRPATYTQPAGYTAATTYTVPYTVTTNTAYMMSPTATTTAGTLTSGDTVYLRSGASLDTSTNANGFVPAKTADGRMIYVRAADLRMK